MKKFTMKMLLVMVTVIAVYGADTVVILDTSGSVAPFEKDIKHIVEDSLKKNIPIIGFGSSTYSIRSISDIKIGGSTALSQAITYVNNKYSNSGVKMVVIYTDGVPNDPKASVRASLELRQNSNIRICTSYIANNKIVPDVMRKISNKIFIGSANDAIKHCNSKRVREILIGKRAVVEHHDVHKFDF